MQQTPSSPIMLTILDTHEKNSIQVSYAHKVIFSLPIFYSHSAGLLELGQHETLSVTELCSLTQSHQGLCFVLAKPWSPPQR